MKHLPIIIVGKGVLTPTLTSLPPPPLFYEDCSILPTLPFSNFVQHPQSPVTSKPHPHCSFCCVVSLAEWVIPPHLMCYFT